MPRLAKILVLGRFLEKMCNNVLFFATIPEIDRRDWQTGVAEGPDFAHERRGFLERVITTENEYRKCFSFSL